jgi:hypothetical protein
MQPQLGGANDRERCHGGGRRGAIHLLSALVQIVAVVAVRAIVGGVSVGEVSLQAEHLVQRGWFLLVRVGGVGEGALAGVVDAEDGPVNVRRARRLRFRRHHFHFQFEKPFLMKKKDFLAPLNEIVW